MWVDIVNQDLTTENEKSLWRSVLRTYVVDAEVSIKKIEWGIRRFGEIDDLELKRIERIVKSLKHPWTVEIGSFAEVHPDHIINYIDRSLKEVLKRVGNLVYS